MAEDSNKFIKGMNQDIHPGSQIQHTYRDMRNFVPLSKDGDIYSITNEDGTELFSSVTFPTGKKVIGYSVLNNDIIVILAGDDGTSQVGYIREDNSNLDPSYGFYHPVAPYDSVGDTYPEDNSEFGFNLSHPVDCVSRKLINGNRVLYYTDNLNPFGRIELEVPPEVGAVKEQSKLIFDQEIPTINLSEIKENIAGSLVPGVYQFVTRYVTANGGTTTFGIPCDPISIVPSAKDEGVDAYHGEHAIAGIVNKNIILTLGGLDLNYQEVQVVVTRYSATGVFVAEIVANIPITSTKVDFTYSGITGEEIAITREEIRQVPVSYKRAKCIEQKDNTLFLSNLADNPINDEALQEVANHITVGYSIKELPYSGREGSSVILDDAGQFQVTNISIAGPDQILVEFNQDISFTTFTTGIFNNSPASTVDANYGGLDHTLVKNGEPATGLIDNALTAVGDTVLIDGITFTCVAAGTVVDPTTEFEIDGSPSQVSQNLATAMSSVPARNFLALVEDVGGTLETFVIWPSIAGNGQALNYTGGITGDPSLAGANTTVTTYTASDMEQAGTNGMLYTFTGPTQITPLDDLKSNNIRSLADYTITTSPNGSPAPPVAVDDIVFGGGAKGFTDYVDEKVIFDTKSYRRGEVYSFGFFLLFKDGSTSFVYHISGNDKTETALGKHYPVVAPYQTGDTSGTLGTYLSDNEYPLDQFYPGTDPGDENIPGLTTRNIRHHVMPNPNQEPHFRDLGGGDAMVRTMGVTFTMDPSYLIPDEIKADVQEIVFVRERRNVAQNKSVMASGLVNRLVETAETTDGDGAIAGTEIDGVRSEYCLQEMPMFNNFGDNAMSVSGATDTQKSSGELRRGVCYPGAQGAQDTFTGGGHSFSDGRKLNTSIRGNRAFYHCPESLLSADTGVNTENLIQAKLIPWLLLSGDATSMAHGQPLYEGAFGRDWTDEYGYCDSHGNYTSYDNTYVYQTGVVASGDRVVVAAEDRSPAIRKNKGLDPDSGVPNDTNTEFTQGGWEVKVSNPESAQPNDPYEIEHEFLNPSTELFYIDHHPWRQGKAATCVNNCRDDERQGGLRQTPGGGLHTGGTTIDITNHLYSAEIEQLTQYGQLGNASYIPIGRFDHNDTTFLDVYSGDTYITKFSFNTGVTVLHHPWDRSADSSHHSEARAENPRGYRGNRGQKANGYDLRACHYYFVESDINTYYRHRPEEEERQDYFPNEPNPQLNLRNFFAWAGNIQAYNGLYSYENNVKEYFVKGSTQQVVTDFENRIIYSEQAFSDSVVDSYRSFLVNNYYDLPSNTGPIWDSFVHANTLYMHTPKSCWRTFAEPAATLSGGNISDVVLGTGPLFARPSVEVLTTEGGYGGSISQYGGSHTSMGYIYPDVLQGKVFALAVGKGGPFLKDLSLEGMYTFLHKNMDNGLTRFGGVVDLANVTTTNAHLIDNPYQGIGFVGGYDYKLKRAWVTKQGEFTLSYSVLMQAWSAFHDYQPNIAIPFDNRVFFILNNTTGEVWEMNVGNKGEYFGTVYDSTLETSAVTPVPRTYNNQMHTIEITDQNGVKQRDDFWNTMQAWTDRQNTGVYNMVPGNTFDPTKAEGEAFYKFRNDAYNTIIPRDSVVDNGGNIFDANNIYLPQGGTAPQDDDYAFRERIKGDYSHFAYSYDNTNNNVFVLREIKTIFEQNFR